MKVANSIISASAALLFATLASASSASPLTNPLTAEQVTCHELQLERLAKRLAVVEGLSGSGAVGLHPSLLLWSASSSGGTYSALAVTDGITGDPGHLRRQETQLALDLVVHPDADSLSPARPLLAQASLVRREQSSNLVNPTPLAPYLTVNMALEPNAQNPFQPTIPLVVNDLVSASDGEQPASRADGAGRGLTQDGLTSSCDSALTDFDQRIFNILARTVRVSECVDLPGLPPFCNLDGSAFNVTVFRGADPHTYRANVYLNASSCEDTCTYRILSKVALQFRIDWDSNGRLTTGEVSVLPGCLNGQASGCSDPAGGGAPTFILPPIWPGSGHQGQQFFDRGAFVWDVEPGSPMNVLSAPVNWSSLLADSGWN